MAVRWKAGQRRKRWTEQAVSLPADALIRLQEANVSVDSPPDASFTNFAKQLQSFGELPSTFAQIAATKALSDALLSVLKSNNILAETALFLYVELLFLDNSRPLHRGLLTPLSRLSKDWETKVANVLNRRCLEYGQGGIKHRRFSIVGVATSISTLPQRGILGGVLETCLNLFALSSCYDVSWVLEYSNEGGRPPPNTMEDCQDAVGSLYYMLQHYPQRFIDADLNARVVSDATALQSRHVPGDLEALNGKPAVNLEERDIQLWSGSSGPAVYGRIIRTLIDVLQTSALSRDCVVAAGVGLCAAAQFQNTQEKVALMLAKSVFASSATCSAALLSIVDGVSEGPNHFGLVDATIRDQCQSSLPAEVSRFSEFGKLCILRGLLTALPRSTLNIPLLIRESTSAVNEGGSITGPAWKLWTILYDGILPALCALSEGSVDSHFKFHTVTALQICLQQVRASVTGKLTQEAVGHLAEAANIHKVLIRGYEPLPQTMISRVLQIVWNNWEDPLTQTVKQVQAIFDLLVDVQYVFAQQREIDDYGNAEVSNGEFVKQIASNLLAEGRYRKGKYVPLASLALRIGSEKLLSMKPNLLFDTFHAQSDDDVCCSASSFLKTFLERLKEDCWSSTGEVMEGDVAFRRLWIPPLLTVLLSGNSRLRTNLNTYALPVAMRIDPDSVVSILAFILDGADRWGERSSLNWEDLKGAPGLPSHLAMHQRVAALISVLKVARSLGFIDGDIEQVSNTASSASRVSNGGLTSTLSETVVVRIQNEVVQVPVSWLELALTHLDDSLRVDAAELICLNPKTASMPSSLELKMLKLSIPLNMRCSSTSFRMRWTSLLMKFFHRVRTAAYRQHRLEKELQPVKVSSSAISYGDEKKKKRVAAAEKQEGELNNSQPNEYEGDEQVSRDGVSIAEMQEFMQLLSQYLLSSLYPSAPYERKNMAMELLKAIIEVWSLSPDTKAMETNSLVAETFSPYQSGLLSAEATLVVVGAIVDSWDKLRESAFRILVRYPTPLPGLESTTSIEQILYWAKGLVNSPRVRESDAGALVLRLIFRKYVLDLGWTVNVHTVTTSTGLDKGSAELGPDRVGLAIAEYVESLNDWLEWGIDEGDKDLVKACSHSFVHGVLLTLRYTMEELPWTSLAVQVGAQRLRMALHKLISLLLRVTTLTLWVVAANALNLPPDMTSDTQAGVLDGIMDVNMDEESFEEDGDGVAPLEQMIMVGCWLSMKEVSLLLGTVAREVPLPGSSAEGDSTTSLSSEESTSGLLNAELLEAMGAHFLQVLLAMKHNGAIDKTRTGFIALCDRLLRSPDPRLNKFPETWMIQLLERTGAKGQTVDNLLRRSAGIPAAFLALFLAEPDGAPKKLLPMAMKWLIDTSKKFVFSSTKENAETNERKSSHGDDLVHVVDNTTDNMELQTKMKQRDEGVVPTVHAFNAMRVAFHDTNLATDTSGFCAEGLITTIQAFSCPYWEVRNSATLAFAALVHRTIGFLNVYKRESARRAITGFEFFHRFPTLHPFLLQELRSATLQLQHEEGHGYQGHGMTSTLHPSLGPVLIILSRLKPSVISTGVGDWVSPSAFRPYVTSCATLENFHVRVLASRALAPLVSSDDLPKVLLELAERLPCATYAPKNALSYSAIHGVLLQMTVLLTSNCSALPDLDMRQMILTKLYSEVEQRLWLGSIHHCPCHMVVGAFYSMLEAMLGIAKMCAQVLTSIGTLSSSLQAHLLHLCSECLEDEIVGTASWKDSMRVLVCERAATLYFGTILSYWSSQSSDASTEGYSGLMMSVEHNRDHPSDMGAIKDLGLTFKRALSHRMYEVRLSTLKVLKKFSHCLTMPATEGSGWIGSYLQPLLVERLSLETHPGCVRRILHVFFAWRSVFLKQSSIPIITEDSNIAWNSASLVIWDRVLHIYKTSKHAKTKEVAMKCMGACLSQMLGYLCQGSEGDADSKNTADRSSRPEPVRKAVDEWICLVNKHSAASESVNFRRATAEAIVASRLLDQVPLVASKLAKDSKEGGRELEFAEWYGRSLLQVWCVCVKLLEDEDPDLRQSLALSLLDVLALSWGTDGNAHFNAAVPSQVERVVQLAFQCLSSHFGSWHVYWEMLAEWVWGSEDIDALLVNDVDLVRRLFDKEIDNHHEEELVFVQLCCLHLRQLMPRGPMSSSPEVQSSTSLQGAHLQKSESCEAFVGVWRQRFLDQAKSCAELTLRMQEKMSWVGGVTNHQDAFKMVYRRLLGLLTFARPCSSSQTQVLKEQLLEISRLLQQLPLNPLVSNVMFKVLQAYETHAGIDLDAAAYRVSMGLAFCDKFEPLFLVE
ncbi:hypothetical protein KC19_VG313400 [Ceratodon purpureus]|uniref:DUF2428 domain-containing protein n=1 Tax=Ceratodon purpureus TaxID=3225 RepID=A0A8T0HWF7_CERPU|nr:hypothetical protein KC19_VG313400 [Ceratodon purpureus]KAG0575048.1 hypothetical protein KC19_VG313400 [Ceratodon purpureus]KAG0575049.1 hypothetical protein KC19_VG313400 [Ceratodon purpureus]